MKSIAITLALIAIASATQEKESIYAFPKDETQPYEVAGELKVSFKGSHADFLEKGNDAPLKLEYRALFENAVIEPAKDGMATRLERRVKTLKVQGEFKGEAIKIDYDAKRPQEKRFSTADGQYQMVEFFTRWCTNPSQFNVDGLGKVSLPDENLNRLVVKAGMLYWTVKPDAMKWDTKEKIAVPLLHHKIGLIFHNSFVKTETRGERKFMVIDAKAEIAETEGPEEQAPREVTADPAFKASGGVKVEIDLTKGRLHSVRINVKIEFNGEAPVSDGSKGALRGEVTFVESQVYKDK